MTGSPRQFIYFLNLQNIEFYRIFFFVEMRKTHWSFWLNSKFFQCLMHHLLFKDFISFFCRLPFQSNSPKTYF